MTRAWVILLAVSAAVVVAEGAEPGRPKDADPKAPAKAGDGEIDVHQTAERIAENAQKAGNRLKNKDPGEDTRRIQQEIVKDIDTLIRQAQKPPPQKNDMSQMPPMNPPPDAKRPRGGSGGPSKQPMGGASGGSPQAKSGGSPQAKPGAGGGSGSRQDRRARRDRRPRGDSPMGMGDPMDHAGGGGKEPMPASPAPKDGPGGERDGMPQRDGDRFGKASPKRQSDKLADLYKDVWGHLPDRLRQEMDLYYREKFMPRYSELLRQYYAALAEQKKSGPEDR